MANHVVSLKHPIKLKDIDPADTDGVKKTPEVEASMDKDLERLGALQELLYVAGANAVLVVLQGMDTSGKDGTIRHVFRGVSPLGCSVAAFKAPTAEELAHDYLWRIHNACPEKGMLTIFNRSHYESVLVEKVHNIIDKDKLERRYDEINNFERTLSREGTIIVKFMLHISKGEQAERLEERIDTPEKQWKVAAGDWTEREKWDEYQALYEELLNRTSTEWAPWTVVPADHKWSRNYVVASRLLDVLGRYEDEWTQALRARGDAQMAELRSSGVHRK
ncbi:MAG TPA: PPK2 family polyphosphate kinase [Armatimonadota bacterium]|jgi:PPK2 family polyphosphate:nucleotide phosphotransferase